MRPDHKAGRDSARLEFERHGGRLRIIFSGPWTIYSNIPARDEILSSIKSEVSGTEGRRLEVILDAADVTTWDSSLAVVMEKMTQLLQDLGCDIVQTDLPQGLADFMRLARSGLSPNPAHKEQEIRGLVGKTGRLTIRFLKGAVDFLSFTGELALGFVSALAGRAAFRLRDFLVLVQDAGADSLGIVSVVSFLVGVILGFVGTVQLEQFGAEIYVANLVGIAMARDMGAMMCGIIVAGRTGAAYAAHIGTMQVNEEIDALKTLGIKPVDYLVVPRVMALALMVPLLVIYSDMMGLAGGAFVGAGLTEITLTQFIEQTIRAVPLKHFVIGVTKALVYGVIVAAIGCLRGLQCGRSAAAVGRVTTSSVVTSIVWIIVSCAVITVVCYVLGV